MGVNYIYLMSADNLKQLEHQERIKGQPLKAWANTNFAIRTNVSHPVDFNACYRRRIAERVGNNTNRMSAPGKFLRHFPDCCGSTEVCREGAGGNHCDRKIHDIKIR